jgi:Lipopolysaccharide-assembly
MDLGGSGRKFGLALTCGMAALVVWGCGYTTDRAAQFRTENASARPIRTIAVPIFQSREFRRDIELQVTEALKKRIEAETPYKLANQNLADTVLTGEVLEVRQGTIGRDFVNVRPRETAATLVVRWQWKDLRTGEILVDRPRFVHTVDYIRPVGEDFYHAMQRASNEMAERIVEQMLDDNW